MNTLKIIDLLNKLHITELEFERPNWCVHLFDQYGEDSDNYDYKLFWSEGKGFKVVSNANLDTFRKTEEATFYNSVSWLTCFIDDETRCVIFDVDYYYDSDDHDRTYGIVPIKSLEENGIKIICKEEL